MACYLRIYCTDVRKAQSTDSCCRSSTVQHEQNTRHAKNKYLWKTRIETRLEPDERRPVSVVMHSADIARACSLREAVQIPTIIAAWSATSPLLPREQRAKLAAEHLHNKMPAWDLSPEAVLYVVATLHAGGEGAGHAEAGGCPRRAGRDMLRMRQPISQMPSKRRHAAGVLTNE